jgi:hypothetical protein
LSSTAPPLFGQRADSVWWVILGTPNNLGITVKATLFGLRTIAALGLLSVNHLQQAQPNTSSCSGFRSLVFNTNSGYRTRCPLIHFATTPCAAQDGR